MALTSNAVLICQRSAASRPAERALPAADLLECGIDPEEVYVELYARAPEGRVRSRFRRVINERRISMKVNNKSISKLTFLSLVFLGVMAASSVDASAQEREEKPNAKLAKKAKITLEQAREIALKEDSGTVESEELEKEKGKLVYSFDIRNAKGTITEIWVDAKNGKLVHKSEEDATAEAKEKAADMKKKGKN